MTSAICKLCPLSTGAQVPGYGPKDAKLIVIGEFPNTDDERTGIPFSKSKDPKREKATELIRRFIQSIGLDPEREVFWVHALRCSPYHQTKVVKGKQKAVKVDKDKHIGVCFNHLERDLQGVTTPVVLLLGTHAVTSVLGRTDGVGPNRVFPHQVTLAGVKRHVIVSYSPATVDRRTLWNLDANMKRTTRWSPPGSALWFFKRDIKQVRDALRERGLLPAK